MRERYIEILKETQEIIKTGKYAVNNKEVTLKLSQKQMSEAIVMTDREVKELIHNQPYDGPLTLGGRCRFEVNNTDSFTAAVSISVDNFFQTDKSGSGKVLVLNFANPVEPGGGVYRGAKAQEEDLCRKSTLLASLESRAARKYYRHNRRINSRLSTDYMILSPEVEIFRDENNNLLEETVTLSVLTCAAPYVKQGMHGISNELLERVIFQRIMGMLHVAVKNEYKYLVLGAWGCGAFGNDAEMVAKLFYEAFRQIKCGRNDWQGVNSLFKRVEFAVLSRTEQKYNLNCFKKYFDDFHRYEDEALRQNALNRKKENEKWLDAIRGSMIGSAVCGVSDDTKAALLAAKGILVGATQMSLRGISGPPEDYIREAYYEWKAAVSAGRDKSEDWLVDRLIREPKALRGNDEAGITRVLPYALYFQGTLPLEGATVACTLDCCQRVPVVALVKIVNRVVYGRCALGESLHDIINECGDVLRELFICENREDTSVAYLGHGEYENLKRKEEDNMSKLLDIMKMAINLSHGDGCDDENIALIGKGDTDEEALGIALYCALKHYDDFTAAVTAASGHDGERAYAAAITGSIVGAHVGYGNIPQDMKTALRLHDLILEIADDICHKCQMDQYSSYWDVDWVRKYGAPWSFVLNSSLRGVELQPSDE